MPRRLSFDSVKHRTANIFAIIIVGYLALGSIKLIVENYRIHQDRQQLREDMAALEQQNLELRNLTAYYRTDSYKEKEARARLGYQRPGERVVIVSQPSTEDRSSLTQPGFETQEPEPPSNPERWWRYFFGSDDPQS